MKHAWNWRDFDVSHRFTLNSFGKTVFAVFRRKRFRLSSCKIMTCFWCNAENVQIYSRDFIFAPWRQSRIDFWHAVFQHHEDRTYYIFSNSVFTSSWYLSWSIYCANFRIRMFSYYLDQGFPVRQWYHEFRVIWSYCSAWSIIWRFPPVRYTTSNSFPSCRYRSPWPVQTKKFLSCYLSLLHKLS